MSLAVAIGALAAERVELIAVAEELAEQVRLADSLRKQSLEHANRGYRAAVMERERRQAAEARCAELEAKLEETAGALLRATRALEDSRA